VLASNFIIIDARQKKVSQNTGIKLVSVTLGY